MAAESVIRPTNARGEKRTWFQARLVTLIYVYYTCLFGWAVLRFLFQDQWSWLFLISSLAAQLFLPLPFILLVNLWLRQRAIWVGFAVSLSLWLVLYGGLFLPKPSVAQAGGRVLTVMTSNVLGHNLEAGPIIEAIRASDADVIGIGELNPQVAELIQNELAYLYPHQVLSPRMGVSGTGIISRYPLQETGQTLPGDVWVGKPQILTLDFAGTDVRLIYFHAIPLATTGGDSGLMFSVIEREKQAQSIVDYVGAQEAPVVVLGDLNAGDQNKAYRILTTALTDAWRESGWGMGHTFPGASSRFSSRPVILGIPAPKWMIRIDYVFHSAHWRAESAWIGPWDGLSDHRPVIARLTLAP